MSATAGDVLGAYVRQHAATVRSTLGDVLADGDDAIHAARIATRRLRSVLKTFAPLWAQPCTHLRGELRWYASALSRPRDLEVVEGWLGDLVAVSPARGAEAAAVQLTHRVRHDRDHALHAMREELAGERFYHLSASLPPDEWSEIATVPAGMILPALVAGPVVRAGREESSLPHGADRPAALHELRKTAKAARYGLDALGAGAAAQAAMWKRVTESLGIAQDATVAHEVLDELRERAPEHLEVWDNLGCRVADAAAAAERDGLGSLRAACAMPYATVDA